MSARRVYGAADLDTLRDLAAGTAITLEVVVAESDDEQDEYDALLTAADDGPVVVAAEVESGATIRPQDVQSFHVDADGSGDLAWYAPTELDQVIALLADR